MMRQMRPEEFAFEGAFAGQAEADRHDRHTFAHLQRQCGSRAGVVEIPGLVESQGSGVEVDAHHVTLEQVVADDSIHESAAAPRQCGACRHEVPVHQVGLPAACLAAPPPAEL